MAKGKEKFEDILKRLEDIVAKMESGGLNLDESLSLYEEGMKKSEKLNAMLSEARDKVMKLVSDKSGKPTLDLFDKEDD